MKKIYIVPAVHSFDFEAEQMIAASNPANFNSGFNGTEVDARDAMTNQKSSDIWGSGDLWK